MAVVIVIVVIVGIIALIGLVLVGIYNGLVRARVRTRARMSPLYMPASTSPMSTMIPTMTTIAITATM